MGKTENDRDLILKEIGKGPVSPEELKNRLVVHGALPQATFYRRLRMLRESGKVQVSAEGRLMLPRGPPNMVERAFAEGVEDYVRGLIRKKLESGNYEVRVRGA